MALGKLVGGVPALTGRILAMPGVARLLPARNLRLRLGMILSWAAIAVALAITALVSLTGERRIAANIGQSIGLIANQMADTLDRGMFERYREISIIGGLRQIRDPAAPLAERRELLDRLQATLTDYAWIGIADRDGSVIVATQGVLEAENVSDRPWFTAGLQGRHLGDVREDPQLASQLLSESNGDPPRFVAVAVPLTDGAGDVWGVLGAQVNYSLARSVEASVLAGTGEDLQAEVFVVGADGNELLTPPAGAGPGSLTALDSVKAAQSGRHGYQIERWPDGATYVTGYASSRGSLAYPGLGWTVLVRQSTEAAFQPARELQQQILTVGLAAALLLAAMGWYLAGLIAGPMLAIASAARQIERGERGASIPQAKGNDELAVLSQSLDSLVESLRMRERDLQRLAAMHEQRVRERTAELEEVNLRLEQLSSTDALTGLANRGQFDRALEREWRLLARSEEPLSLIMIDIDHFKGYNDTYGHQQGDDCLRQVAGALFHTATRAGDLVARYGGEEFVVVLSHMEAAGAMLVAEKLRRAVFELRIPHKANPVAPGVSISLGVATVIPQRDGAPADLIKLADSALYRAKSEGRDRAVQEVYIPPPPAAPDPAATHVDMARRPFQLRRRPQE